MNLPSIKISLIHILIRSFHGPLDVIFKASGRIRQYQIVSSLVNVVILPISGGLLRLSYPLNSVFFTLLFFEVVLWIALVILAKSDGLRMKEYIRYVLINVVLVTVLSFICAYSSQLIQIHFLVKVALLVLMILGIIFGFGVSKSEKKFVINCIKRR